MKTIATLNCPATKECQNNRCFWRQRDYFGVCPWYIPPDRPEAIIQEKLRKSLDDQYGTTIFPEFEVFVGTNCLHLTCKECISQNEENINKILIQWR